MRRRLKAEIAGRDCEIDSIPPNELLVLGCSLAAAPRLGLWLPVVTSRWQLIDN
jgi:hypothetical protein